MHDNAIGFLAGVLVGIVIFIIFTRRFPKLVVKRIAKYLNHELPEQNFCTDQIIETLLIELFKKGQTINQQSLEILEQCQILIRQTEYTSDKQRLLEMLSKEKPEEFQLIIPRSLQKVLDITYTLNTRNYIHLFLKVKEHAEALAKFRYHDKLANFLRREILKRSLKPHA